MNPWIIFKVIPDGVPHKKKERVLGKKITVQVSKKNIVDIQTKFRPVEYLKEHMKQFLMESIGELLKEYLEKNYGEFGDESLTNCWRNLEDSLKNSSVNFLEEILVSIFWENCWNNFWRNPWKTS